MARKAKPTLAEQVAEVEKAARYWEGRAETRAELNTILMDERDSAVRMVERLWERTQEAEDELARMTADKDFWYNEYRILVEREVARLHGVREEVVHLT
jgi:hypothetical protein